MDFSASAWSTNELGRRRSVWRSRDLVQEGRDVDYGHVEKFAQLWRRHVPDTPHYAVSMLTLALYQPDIPQNAGTMLRTCACLGVEAAIIEPAAFPTSDRHFRRAGLDYLDALTLTRHVSFAAFEAWRRARGRRLVLLSTKAETPYTTLAFRADDVLVVGRESAGVPPAVHEVADRRIRIPLRPPSRSLNVAVAAAMVLGEALRQLGAPPDG